MLSKLIKYIVTCYKDIISATTACNQFKNRLDKHRKMHDIVFNYRADFAETGSLAWVD